MSPTADTGEEYHGVPGELQGIDAPARGVCLKFCAHFLRMYPGFTLAIQRTRRAQMVPLEVGTFVL